MGTEIFTEQIPDGSLKFENSLVCLRLDQADQCSFRPLTMGSYYSKVNDPIVETCFEKNTIVLHTLSLRR